MQEVFGVEMTCAVHSYRLPLSQSPERKGNAFSRRLHSVLSTLSQVSREPGAHSRGLASGTCQGVETQNRFLKAPLAFPACSPHARTGGTTHHAGHPSSPSELHKTRGSLAPSIQNIALKSALNTSFLCVNCILQSGSSGVCAPVYRCVG